MHDFLRIVRRNYVSIFTVSNILSLICQNSQRSLDPQHIPLRMICYAYDLGLLAIQSADCIWLRPFQRYEGRPKIKNQDDFGCLGLQGT